MTMRLVAFFIALSLPAAVLAQDGAGSITGTVRDASGASVPGASVDVANVDGGVSVQALTDEQGAYRVDGLAPGRYHIETILDGFETDTRDVTIEAGRTLTIAVSLSPARFTEKVVVTARRVEEVAQEVPIPLSVVSGSIVAETGSFNVNRLQELVPTVQFYSTNPRNSAINIRGLGAPFGLTNDGLDRRSARAEDSRPPFVLGNDPRRHRRKRHDSSAREQSE